MILVYTARSTMEKDALESCFADFKLPVKVVPKSREYSEIIAGTSESIFDFYVEETQTKLAQEIIKSFRLQNEDPTSAKPRSPVKLGSIIILSVMGMMGVPLIFNIISTYLLGQFMQQKETPKRKLFAFLVVVIGWTIVAIHLNSWLLNWLHQFI